MSGKERRGGERGRRKWRRGEIERGRGRERREVRKGKGGIEKVY